MKVFFLSIMFLGLMCSATAQQTVSLEQSRQAALAYSNAIKNGQLKVSSADLGMAAAKSSYLPSVSGTGLGLYGFKDFVPAIPDMLNKGINNFYLIGVTATQPIYTGGKIETGVRLAALQQETSKIMAKQSVDSVLLLTTQKYWNLVNLQEQEKTLSANEVLLNNLLKMQNDMLASGLIARNDLLKVKVQLSQLIVNRSKLQNGRRLALFDFSIYTGMAYDSLMVMQDTLDKTIEPLLPGGSPDTTVEGIADYQLLLKQVQSESLQTKLSKAEYLPSLSVGLSASQAGSFDNTLGSTFVPAALATLSIPISDGLWGHNKQKVKQRMISEQIAQNNLRDVSKQLQVGILQHWYDMKDELMQIRYAKENLLQATENLKVNQDNYKAGLSTTTDVLDAQAFYQQAALTLNTAYSDFQVKKAMYEYATGKINSK